MNPAGGVLVAGGVICIIVGVRGSQSQTWAALFDKSSNATINTPAALHGTSTVVPVSTGVSTGTSPAPGVTKLPTPGYLPNVPYSPQQPQLV